MKERMRDGLGKARVAGGAARLVAMGLLGPLAAAGGGLVVLWLVFGAHGRGLLDWWLLTTILAPQHVLPLAGFALALATAGRGALGGGLAAFGLGLGSGLVGEAVLLAYVSALPDAAALVTPLASLVIGLCLLAPRATRVVAVPLCGLLVGVGTGLFIRLTDPSLRDPVFPLCGTVAAVWLVLALAFTLRMLRRPWFDVAGRIGGSWLIAIGLLHSGAVVAQAVRAPTVPPASHRLPDPAIPPEAGELFPDPDSDPGADGGPEFPDAAVPRGLDPARQP